MNPSATPRPTNLIPFSHGSYHPPTGTRAMNTFNPVPSLDQFHLHSIEQACLDEGHAQITFSVELEHDQVTQRILVGLLDENREKGACIAIYPATGEVCDLTNGGGVIGYLSLSPIMPGQSMHCELLLYKYGANFVCSARTCGETFLYPAFSMGDCERLTALVGYDSGAGVQWDDESLRIDSARAVA